MGSWPFTRLHYGCGRCIAIAGPHILVLDASSGEILHSTRCANAISCSAIDEKHVYLATTGEDKMLNVWKLEGLQLKSSRELPKKATVVRFSLDAQTILVADKFGDVFGYPLNPPQGASDDTIAARQPDESRKRDSVASHENPHGTLVLGHASIITSLLLTHDGRYIVTADRDEHIRVSRYPQGYIIERYCLGHRLFVSALCLPSFDSSSLVSGGGDPALHIWEWMSGTLKCQIPVAEAVRPFLKVREKSKQGWHQGGAGDATGRRGRKPRGREKKGVKASGETSAEPGPASEATGGESVPEGELVFALAKLEALELNGEQVLVFSAVGGSALFYCAYPSQRTDIPSIRHVDFLRPILDFALGDDHQIIVSLDTAWSPPPGAEIHGVEAAIILVGWQDGEFKAVDGASSLTSSLNGIGSLEASDAEITSLDLYSALALLPKHADGPEEGEGAGEQESDMRPDTPEDSQGDTRKQHTKVAGRLKTKQALLRKQELDQGSSHSASGDEREPKKLKTDS